MCIRDSRNTGQDQGGEGHQRRLFPRFLALLLCRTQQGAGRLFDRPVQTRDCADCACGWRHQSEGELDCRLRQRTPADGRQGSVSYTHLDVYKRQVIKTSLTHEQEQKLQAALDAAKTQGPV